jgi:endonuclease/exonuclease/phosphatase family metal-dependent hydrolase
MHTEAPLSIRIITHNTRYATTSPFPGEAPWESRLPLLISQFRYHTAHVPSALLCFQEVLHQQLLDIFVALNSDSEKDSPEWQAIGVGRDDGVTAGEYSVILYRSASWKLLHSDTVWLSETPRIPGSKGWDAASVRIVTIAVLRHRDSGKELALLNTHLDDQGIISRRESAKMLRVLAQKHSECGTRPVVLTGDLNSEPDGDDAYQTLTTDCEDGMTMIDTRERCGYNYGDYNTFSGFEGKAEDATRLDHVFISPARDSAVK